MVQVDDPANLHSRAVEQALIENETKALVRMRDCPYVVGLRAVVQNSEGLVCGLVLERAVDNLDNYLDKLTR